MINFLMTYFLSSEYNLNFPLLLRVINLYYAKIPSINIKELQSWSMTKYYFQDNLGFKFIAKICGNLFSLILLSLEFAIKILCINEMEMNITQSYNNKKYPNKFHCQGDLVLNNWFILRISCQYMLIFTIGGSKVLHTATLIFLWTAVRWLAGTKACRSNTTRNAAMT